MPRIMGGDKLNIIVFPWLAFGHMLPFLELSKSLAKRGHHISFISTPRNIERLPKVPLHLSTLIDFISFSLPSVEGLPDAAEATSDVAPNEIEHLIKAFDGLEHPFSKFIQDSHPKPDWIIHDGFQCWIPEIAAKACVPRIFFSIFTAPSIFFFEHISECGPQAAAEEFTRPPPWVPFSTKVAFRLHEARDLISGSWRANASGVSMSHRYRLATKACCAVAVRSCMELEADWLNLQQIREMPLIPVGLLPPPASDNRADVGAEIIEWLEKQSSKSVVYIAFGSESVLTTEKVHTVALGLEIAKVPFLWVLRKPAHLSENKEILPEGFKERTRDRGMVVMGWVPQLKILAHESMRGFLTHCGPSSVIEGLMFGCPFVLLPSFVDQGLYARAMVEKGVGIEVERDEEDGSFTEEGVAKALRLLMVEEGEIYRNKAEEMRETLFSSGCQEKYVDGFVQYLVSHRNQQG